MNRRQRRRLRGLAWLMTGIGIGSGVALLWAPHTGEDVRYALGRGYRKAVKHIGRHSEDLRDRAEDLMDQAKDLRESVQDIGKRGSKLWKRYRSA